MTVINLETAHSREPHDPFRNCERKCNHDLVRGVLTSDLLREDGPNPPSNSPLFVNPIDSE